MVLRKNNEHVEYRKDAMLWKWSVINSIAITGFCSLPKQKKKKGEKKRADTGFHAHDCIGGSSYYVAYVAIGSYR